MDMKKHNFGNTPLLKNDCLFHDIERLQKMLRLAHYAALIPSNPGDIHGSLGLHGKQMVKFSPLHAVEWTSSAITVRDMQVPFKVKLSYTP